MYKLHVSLNCIEFNINFLKYLLYLLIFTTNIYIYGGDSYVIIIYRIEYYETVYPIMTTILNLHFKLSFALHNSKSSRLIY